MIGFGVGYLLAGPLGIVLGWFSVMILATILYRIDELERRVEELESPPSGSNDGE
ncbi:hypothetical protein [Halosolutus gelatinilyticus]|uniref:hypothetical protein n=1 Tax=Halosolutus gelatinilyticus TaxID=2931975 RepID=UPI001FF65CF9|nr:hypothetical protein [Halosolutus gelatinilyticus]